MNGPIAEWPPIRSHIEESSLDRTIVTLWTFPTDHKFASTETERWRRLSEYLSGAGMFNFHGAGQELAWLAEIALQRSRMARLVSEIERNGLQESLAIAWRNARSGGASWLAVHDWLRSSPRFLVHDCQELHDELAWLAQIAAVLWDGARPELKEVQHAHA